VAVGEEVFVEWAPVPGAIEYEVALVDPDGRPVRDPAYASVKGESATISMDGALAGRPYRIAVRGRNGETAGADAFSEEIVVIDTAAPFASAIGVPGPGAEASIELAGKDDLALDHYLVRYREAGSPGEPLMLVGDDLLSGTEASASLVFSLPEAVRGKSIEFVVDIIDSAGNAGREALPAVVGLNGEIQFETEATPSEEPSATTPGLMPDGGCSVGDRPARPSSAGGLFAIAAIAAFGAAAGLSRRKPARR
jgi:hypothetical protein